MQRPFRGQIQSLNSKCVAMCMQKFAAARFLCFEWGRGAAAVTILPPALYFSFPFLFFGKFFFAGVSLELNFQACVKRQGNCTVCTYVHIGDAGLLRAEIENNVRDTRRKVETRDAGKGGFSV